MGAALNIRDDVTPSELRRWARREARSGPAARAYAIANALEGMSRAAAARLAGMERQALRDAVVRYNAEGLAGLHERPKGRPPRTLTEGEEAALAAVILKGPDPERDGVCAWTRADLSRWMTAQFAKTYHPSNLSWVLQMMDHLGRAFEITEGIAHRKHASRRLTISTFSSVMPALSR